MRPVPYPSDIEAKGWRLELDYERIESSDTWKLALRRGLQPYLLMLWYEAWKQSPVATLPNDDDVLAAIIGMEPEQFAAAKPILMRNWSLAEDGRLYHETLTEMVLAMIDRRAKDRARVAAWRDKQAGQSDDVTRNTTGQQAEFGRVTRDKRVSTTPEPEPEPTSPSLRSGDGGAAKRGTRLADDWAPSDADLAFCRERRPDLDPASVALQFRNYWTAKAGKDATKLDWGRTWQNWVLGQKTAGPAPRAGAPPIETFRERDQRQAAERVAAFAPQAAARNGLRTIDITPQPSDQPRIGNAA